MLLDLRSAETYAVTRVQTQNVSQNSRLRPKSQVEYKCRLPGGQGDHFRKLERSRKPSVWLFSGWNWVPAMLSIPTIAVSGPPYWAAATKARRSATSRWKECTK